MAGCHRTEGVSLTTKVRLGVTWCWLNVNLDSLQDERGINFCPHNNFSVFPNTDRLAK